MVLIDYFFYKNYKIQQYSLFVKYTYYNNRSRRNILDRIKKKKKKITEEEVIVLLVFV